MTMGEEGKEGVRTYDPKENQNILDAFFSYGHKEIDTARRYADGSTEPVELSLFYYSWDASIDKLCRLSQSLTCMGRLWTRSTCSGLTFTPTILIR
jgi:hypothetical protein